MCWSLLVAAVAAVEIAEEAVAAAALVAWFTLLARRLQQPGIASRLVLAVAAQVLTPTAQKGKTLLLLAGQLSAAATAVASG